MSQMRDSYGVELPDRDSMLYRPRLWYMALKNGCLAEDLSRAYNVTTSHVLKSARRYEQAKEKGNACRDGARQVPEKQER